MSTHYQLGQRIDRDEIAFLLGQKGTSQIYLAKDRRMLQEVLPRSPMMVMIAESTRR